jgi:Tubulin-tyrosine ligase family
MIVHQRVDSGYQQEDEEGKNRTNSTPPDSSREKEESQGIRTETRKPSKQIMPRLRRASVQQIIPEIESRSNVMRKPPLLSSNHQVQTLQLTQFTPVVVQLGHQEPSPNKRQLLESIHKSLPAELRVKMEDELMECREDVLRVMEKWAKLQKHKEDTKHHIREQKKRQHSQDFMQDMQRFLGGQSHASYALQPSTNWKSTNQSQASEQMIARSPPPKKFSKLEKFSLLRNQQRQEVSADQLPIGWTTSKYKVSEENLMYKAHHSEKYATDTSETEDAIIRGQLEGGSGSKSISKTKMGKKINALKFIKNGISIVGTQLQKNSEGNEYAHHSSIEDRLNSDLLPGLISVTPISIQSNSIKSISQTKPLIINLQLNANMMTHKYPHLKQLKKLPNQDYLGIANSTDQVVPSLRRLSRDQLAIPFSKVKQSENSEPRLLRPYKLQIINKSDLKREEQAEESEGSPKDKAPRFFQELSSSKTSRFKGVRLASRNAQRDHVSNSGSIPPLGVYNQVSPPGSNPKLNPHRQAAFGVNLPFGIQKSLSKNLLILQPFDPAHPEFKRDLFYDYTDKVNLSNGIVVNKSKQCQFLYYVGRGNNSELIKELLKRRWWWKQADSSKEAHFLWSQKIKLEKMKKIPIGNGCEYREKRVFPITDTSSKELENTCLQFIQASLKMKTHTNKFLASVEVKSILEKHARCFEPGIITSTLLTNVEENRLLSLGTSDSEEIQNSTVYMPGDEQPVYVPLTYVTYLLPMVAQPSNIIYAAGLGAQKSSVAVTSSQQDVVSNPKANLDGAGVVRAGSQPKSIKNCPSLEDSSILHNVCPTRPSLHNHLQNNNLLGDKKDLFLSILSYCQSLPPSPSNPDPWDILPYTLLLHPDTGMNQFESVFYERQSQGLNNVWILKPAVNSNRGNGIEVCDTVQNVTRFVKQHQGYVIAQLYISEPLLYNGRKFDVRMFMLITWVNGNMKLYFFEDGYVRTATNNFSLENLEDQFIHLTNEAIQVHCDSFSKYEKGNKLTLSILEEYIRRTTKKEYLFTRDTLPSMKVD